VGKRQSSAICSFHQAKLSLSRKETNMTEPVQTGISDNGAGTLAYITFIPAIVFLVMPPYNASSYVRFHAWQSIFLNAVAFLLWVAILIVSTVTMFFAPILMATIHFFIFLCLFAAWVVCVIQALNGKRFQLPVIGALAAKQAGA
jgi:uncharacterized membrane protein